MTHIYSLISTDISDSRLALAKKLGADHAINMKQMPANMEECGDKMKSLNSCIDCTIECSGQDSSVSLGVHVRSFLWVQCCQYFKYHKGILYGIM